MISELTDFSRSMMLSITIQPIPTDEAVKIVQKKLLAIETDITKWQQKQNENNFFRKFAVPMRKCMRIKRVNKQKNGTVKLTVPKKLFAE